MVLSVAELNLLLQLLAQPGYRADINQLKLGSKLSAARRDSLCQSLQAQGWIAGEVTVQRFRASRTGRTLMALDTTALPLTPDEHWVLKSCGENSIPPGQINRRVPANLRQSLIQGLAAQGLVKITQSRLAAVWLTHAGQAFLRHDYCPRGDQSISLTALGHYLAFLRRQETP